jgi:hypothetical protein
MLDPENDVEKEAIKAMQVGKRENMRVVMREGGFDDSMVNDGYFVHRCQGGHFRRFSQSTSLMIEITEDAEQLEG